MNNSINSNLSFKANLVTTLKGNNNIMQPIAKEFARITKNTPGDFFIRRSAESAKNKLKEFEYNNNFFVTTLMNEEFGKDPEKIGKEGIRTIARKLADLFYGLRAEDTYKSKLNTYAENIADLNFKIKNLAKLKSSSDKMGLQSLSDRYDITINKYKKEIDKNKEKVTKAQENFIATLDKYPNNELVALQSSVVSDDFKYDLKSTVGFIELNRRKR